MIIKKITFPSGRETIQLEPETGYKYICNDEVWSTLVLLGISDSVENWHDTNEDPPEPETIDVFSEIPPYIEEPEDIDPNE